MDTAFNTKLMSRNKLYKMWWISIFITVAFVLSDSVSGSQQKGVCFKSNAFVDKIIVNNILGLGFNGSMVETLLKMTDRVISSDNGSIFKSDTFKKSQTWFNDVETGYNEMRQDVRQLKESFSSLSAQIKDFRAAQIRKDVRKLKKLFSAQIKNLETAQMKMFSTLQEATNEILKQQNALKRKLIDCQGFNNATFTNLGAKGRLGPKTLGSHYVNKSQDGMVRLDKGIQMFTVPCTGNYRISVAGAASGYGFYNPMKYRGRGAWMSGTFNLDKGMVLKILIGQTGGYNDYSRVIQGGGGGTFITDINNKPIIIAGGGGGIYGLMSRHWQCDGTTNITGNPNYGGTLYQGGRDGQGATDGPSGVTIRWTGGGGGGLLSDGKDGSSSGGITPPGGGKALLTGGEGGTASNYSPTATGGFGGGGGGGGGGGYSGGAKADFAITSCAGGGGSYNTGSHQQGKDGDNIGEGYAVVTWI